MPELIDLITSNFDYDNFFSAQLTAPMTASDTDIFLDAVPTPSEGVLVIDWDVAASREVIFYNSKTASKVTCPSVANGRGFDDSTATTHLSGANVIMAPVRAWFRLAQQLATTSTAAWKPLGYTPNTIVDNGNRSYTMVFNSVDLTSFISNGMRLRGDPATNQPTQCADLESASSQYFNRVTASLTGITFTDDFTLMAWVKPESYEDGVIIARHNGSTGFYLAVNTSGQVVCRSQNGVGAKDTTTNQSLVLSRWTHVAVSQDVSGAAYAAYMDGALVTSSTTGAGTGITQAGDLQIGYHASFGGYFDGKLAQVAIASAVLSATNIRLIKNQGITSAHCATYNIASAYSFNGVITDINTTNANNLTAQGGALATAADSPYGLDDTGTPGLYEWGIVTSKAFSTNTTITVQAPEGSTWPTLPTSAMITSMWYSTEKVPYGFPTQKSKWRIYTISKTQPTQGTAVAGTWYNLGSIQLIIPVGDWIAGYQGQAYSISSAAIGASTVGTLSTTNNSETDVDYSAQSYVNAGSALMTLVKREKELSLSAATTYYLLMETTLGSNTSIQWYGLATGGTTMVFAECAYL